MHGDKGGKDPCWRFFSKYVKCGVQRKLIIRFVEVQFSPKGKKAGKDVFWVIHEGRILRRQFKEEAPPALNIHFKRSTFHDPSSDIWPPLPLPPPTLKTHLTFRRKISFIKSNKQRVR